ncbi:MAG: fasciclin domain-containing protein [Paludibacter sp.]|nr:fasciclin domain-containing protein [Paludibacter sp.]
MNCKYISKRILSLPLFALILLFGGCYESAWENHIGNDEFVGKNLFEAISTKPQLSIFYSVLKKTGYDELIQNANSYTVFAPENDAWAAVDTSDVEVLTKIVGMLIVYQSYFTDNEQFYKSIKAVNQKNIFYDINTKTFNGAKIVDGDYRTSNGVLHITDKLIERKENIWNFLSTKTTYKQFLFINKLNTSIMDLDKSIATGVYPDGKTKYDTIWKNINNFLNVFPLENEDSVYTYVIVENSGFDLLYNKYKKYFTMSTTQKTDSATNFNVCQDFVFKGIVDITSVDTLENVDGVKVPMTNVQISETYNASNGRVYVINQSNIRLRDKIKPIKIEGENFYTAYDANYVFTRYKLDASGERDIVLSCQESQSDTLWRKVPIAPDTIGRRDSIASKTYYVNNNLVANKANFYIEYKAQVNSTEYDVYYVAYDDIATHFDPTYTSFGVYKIIQKLFVSMPGASTLKYGITDNTSGIANNYLGESTCFVGEGLAGVKELTKLKKWSLIPTTQLIDAPLTTTDSDVMTVPKSGTMTMWLCNSARSITAKYQGMLFLDYILLVPKITED